MFNITPEYVAKRKREQEEAQARAQIQSQQLANSALGVDPAFTVPELPANYDFNDLAAYEQAVRKQQGTDFKRQIGEAKTGIGAQYDTSLKGYQNSTAARRAGLATSLTDTAQKNFQLQNPAILEDLNARGVFSSPTAVAQAQAQALKELEIGNQGMLNAFDTTSRSYEDQLSAQKLNELNQLDLAGTSADLAAQQSGIDAGLDLRRGNLERQMAEANAAREEALARDLAEQQRKQGITQSLIGAGGTLLGASMLGGLGGGTGGSSAGLSGLFGGGSGATGAGLGGKLSLLGSGGSPGTLSGAAAGGSGAAGGAGGLGGIGLGTVGAGLGGYYAGTRAFRPTQAGDQAAMNVGGVMGGVGGALFGGAPGAAAGSFIGTGVGKLNNRLVTGIDNKLGNTAGSLARYWSPFTAYPAIYKKIKDPKKAVSSIGSSIASPVKKVSNAVSSVASSINPFCFDPTTPVLMRDGTTQQIQHVHLGDETKGGFVVSIRISMTGEGTIYDRLGTVVTGSHAVLENGSWIRVRDSVYAVPLSGSMVVISLVTSNHRIYINGETFADEHETDQYESLNMEESLALMNYEDDLVRVN